jgi:hypothetical protein
MRIEAIPSGPLAYSDDHPGAVVLLEPAHRSKPRLEPVVVILGRLLA